MHVTIAKTVDSKPPLCCAARRNHRQKDSYLNSLFSNPLVLKDLDLEPFRIVVAKRCTSRLPFVRWSLYSLLIVVDQFYAGMRNDGYSNLERVNHWLFSSSAYAGKYLRVVSPAFTPKYIYSRLIRVCVEWCAFAYVFN